MRVGIIVDGQAEFRSLACLYPKIDTASTLLKPLYADLQPHARPAKIVRSALPAVRILAKKKVERVVICLDLENRSMCAPGWRDEIESAFLMPCKVEGIFDVKVVLKAQMYENWLVSDTTVFTKCPARFKPAPHHTAQVAPNRADMVDAAKLLKEMAIKTPYHKVKDALLLTKHMDPHLGGQNSRSLRRFLRVVGCELYATQSKHPVA